MLELSDAQIAEFYHRSYSSVDGLWFMKLEEKYGFEAALEIDNEVWKVFPKIQARVLKSACKMGVGLEALGECLTAKLSLEGFSFKAEKAGESGLRVVISRCPWHDLMIKSGRENLSVKVGSLICRTEYSVWAAEFGDNLLFRLPRQICDGAEACVLELSA